jgi:pyridoxal phosphate enzyme (YggS family)|tara:strand:- start:188009 stop:188722 length:714 start_codon:yes stop_codon:yes gene_type:complete
MTIAENYQQIKDDIERAVLHFYCADSLASLPSYTDFVGPQGEFKCPEIIAVSKKQSAQRIDEALALGLRHFGENQLQEAQQHWGERKQIHSDVTLHMIGALQSNKAADAVALFDVIHSVDREKIAKSLKHEMDKQGRSLPCYIQVNIGEEPQKSGILPADLSDFVAYCQKDLGLTIEGLMCIPPADESAGIYFSLLKKYAKTYNLKQLSMGMSSDYEQAAVLGAHYLRVGTALFGER